MLRVGVVRPGVHVIPDPDFDFGVTWPRGSPFPGRIGVVVVSSMLTGDDEIGKVRAPWAAKDRSEIGGGGVGDAGGQ